MWDAVVGVGLVGAYWLHPYPLRALPLSGYPLALLAIALAWWGRLFPAACYVHSAALAPSVVAVACMLVGVDAVQYCVHAATHRRWLGQWLYDAHAVHHRHREPTPLHAFATGYADALVQLLLPIAATTWCVAPNRTALLAFGMCYSHWLLFLHSPPCDARDARIERWGLVSPRTHRRHHAHPTRAFGHLLDWDTIMIRKRSAS